MPEPVAIPVTLPFPYYVSIVQFSLRILGLFLIVFGAARLLEMMCVAFYQMQILKIDFEPVMLLQQGVISSCSEFAAGLYLLFGGRWVIEKLFLPVRKRAGPE